MIQFFSKRINGKKGFTLVELLVVIAILGILALIIIPRLGAYRRDAAEAANKASAASIYNGAQAFLAKNGTLVGFDYELYITGAKAPGFRVEPSPITEDTEGGVPSITVYSHDDKYSGSFPGAGGGGGTPGPTTPTITQTTLAAAVPGDLLVYVVTNRTSTTANALSTPSLTGWNLSAYSGYATGTGDRRFIGILTRIKDGTAADTPGTVTWTNGGSTYATTSLAFTGAGTYTKAGDGSGNNGTSGGTTITITGNAAKGQLVFAAAGYRENIAISSITQLGSFSTFSNSPITMTGAVAWAQAGDAGITNPVVNSASGMGVAAMVVFTVTN